MDVTGSLAKLTSCKARAMATCDEHDQQPRLGRIKGSMLSPLSTALEPGLLWRGQVFLEGC